MSIINKLNGLRRITDFVMCRCSKIIHPADGNDPLLYVRPHHRTLLWIISRSQQTRRRVLLLTHTYISSHMEFSQLLLLHSVEFLHSD